MDYYNEFEQAVREQLREAAQKIEEMSNKPIHEIHDELHEAAECFNEIAQQVCVVTAMLRKTN